MSETTTKVYSEDGRDWLRREWDKRMSEQDRELEHGDNPPFDEACANAHLIAAAPDLYAALKSLVDYEMPPQSGTATARRWGYALRALAKAGKE